MPRVISAPMDLVIATHRGVDIRFEGVNLTSDLPYSRYVTDGDTGLEFHLRGVTNDETRRLDTQFYSALELWSSKIREQGADQADPAPQMPSNSIIEPVKANITDDVGTSYICVGGRIGGTGTDWDATWIYYPAPPPDTQQLILEFTISGVPTDQYCIIEWQAPANER
ncbi:hypothetical protein [Glutamicibacter arilaitensis]|uniref:hypothetical protein n=2 Tax=Glutamicibacter arilaitensis TaxID=256701 RepID=UPI003F93CDCB